MKLIFCVVYVLVSNDSFALFPVEIDYQSKLVVDFDIEHAKSVVIESATGEFDYEIEAVDGTEILVSSSSDKFMGSVSVEFSLEGNICLLNLNYTRYPNAYNFEAPEAEVVARMSGGFMNLIENSRVKYVKSKDSSQRNRPHMIIKVPKHIFKFDSDAAIDCSAFFRPQP